MFKQLTTFVLLAAFMAQTFKGAVIVLDYYTNTAVFAKNCENKVRPKMHCNGKCQLMKKLKEEERKEQENAERRYENKLEVIYYTSFTTVPEVFTSTIQTNHFTPADMRLYDMPGYCFHPPSI